MQRFFVTFPLHIDMHITDSDIVHQLTRVLRVQVSDHIILFSGDGTETEYEIVSIEKKSIWLRGYAQNTPNTEPKKQVTLYQALPNKYEKIEYILQKWVEIGITRFIFFKSDRSQKLVMSPAKIERCMTIAREALEQCGWTIMPEILFHEKFMKYDTSGVNMVLDTIGSNTRISSYDSVQDIAIWVGPEWGWSENERSIMSNNGFIFARFWERVLRTETAGIVIGFGLMNI